MKDAQRRPAGMQTLCRYALSLISWGGSDSDTRTDPTVGLKFILHPSKVTAEFIHATFL